MMPGYETGLLLLGAILLFAMIGWYAKRTRTVSERQRRMQAMIDEVVEQMGNFGVYSASTGETYPHPELLMAIERLRAEVNKLCVEADRE